MEFSLNIFCCHCNLNSLDRHFVCLIPWNTEVMARSKNVVGAIYLKHRDLPDISGDITCIICTAVNNVASDSAVAAQKLRGVWLVYVTDDESRLALVFQGITINEVKITLHDNKPYVMNQRGTPTERIVIKDFPLLELSDDIRQFMATEFVQLVPCYDIVLQGTEQRWISYEFCQW